MDRKGNLAGATVLVTRPGELFSDSDPLVDQILNYGGQVLMHPVVELAEPADRQGVLSAIEDLNRYEWIVFLSRAGVLFLREILEKTGRDLSAIRKTNIAAIGMGTAAVLQQHGLHVDLLPSEPGSFALGTALLERTDGSILFFRGNRGSDEIATMLQMADRKFDVIEVYESRDVAVADTQVLRKLKLGKINWVTVTSSAIARSSIQLFGSALHRTRVASLGSSISREMNRHGFKVAAESSRADFESLVQAMIRQERSD